MTHPALIERITRSLAYMLRHQPDRFGLQLDPHGFAPVPDVVRALNERLGEPVDEADLERAIASGDRPRYELKEGQVRALYGHSIAVEPGEPSQPPEFLFVGIDARDADRASRFGLRGGRRRFLHLALNVDDAREAGKRAGRDYSVLRIFALDAWEEGINFYDRKALFLAEHVPTQFLEVLETNHDGYEPREDERGFGGEWRGGHGDRRDHGRREHGRGGHGPRDLSRRERGHGGGAPHGEPQREHAGRGDRGGPRFEGDSQRHAAANDAGPRHDSGSRHNGGNERFHGDGPRDRGQRHGDRDSRAHEPSGAPASPEDRPRERHRDHGDRPHRRDDRRREHRDQERPAPAAQRPAASAPRAAESESSDFGLGVFDAPRREAPPPRRAPEPVAPPPRPAAPQEDLGDFGAGL